MRSNALFRVALVLCGLGIGSYAVAALAISPGADLVRHVRWFLLAFAFYLGAVVLVLAAERRGGAVSMLRVDLALIVGVAVALRAMLLFTTPSLSDDVFRYVWDGRVLNAGIDPYLYAPSSPELGALRDPLWDGINHKWMATPYPPLAEALFAAVYRIVPGSLAGMQAMAVLFDLAVMLLLIPMLARAGLDRRRVLVYGWNPLVLVQFAHGAHYDAAMLLPLMAAIYLVGRRMHWGSGLLVGVAALVKLVPALAAPLFLPLLGLGPIAAAGLLIVAGLGPWVASAGLGGLLTEAADARFNDSLSFLMVRLASTATSDPEAIARIASGSALALASLFLMVRLWRRRAGWLHLLRSVYLLLGLFLLLNAVVEPWYLTWMVPLLCFVLASTERGLPRLDSALGWLLVSGLVVLTDLTYLPGVGASLWPLVRAIEYGPLFGLFALSGARILRRRAAKRRLVTGVG